MDPGTIMSILSMITGGAGGLASGLSSGGGLFGKKERVDQQPLYNEQGMSALSQLLSQGMQNTDFGNIENQARTKFKTETIPGLAERFTSMGGGQRSSAFEGSLGQAGSGLEEGLASLRSQYGMQQLGMGLKPQFENIFRPRQAGGIEQMFSGALKGAEAQMPELLKIFEGLFSKKGKAKA